MIKFHAILVAGLAMTSPLMAGELVPWGQAGDWAILTDSDRGNACLTEVVFSDGSILRMGFHKGGKEGFLATFNPAWSEFKLDKKYAITYMLDDDAFEGEAHGVELNKMPGAQLHFDSIDFLVDLAEKYTMTISHEGAEVVKIDLKGSGDALKQVIACQVEQKG